MSAKATVGEQTAPATASEVDPRITLTIGSHTLVIKQLNGFESLRITRLVAPEETQTLPWLRVYASVRELDGESLRFPSTLREIELLAGRFTDSEGDTLLGKYYE